MKKKLAVIICLTSGLLFTVMGTVYASEITGTLTTGNADSERISGTVVGGQSSGAVFSSGGGGGGSIVVPAASYSYGANDVSYGVQPVYTGVGGADYSSRYSPRNYLAQTTTGDSSTDTEVLDDESTTTSSTTPIISEPVVDTNPIIDNTETDGTFDFFGISMWFWIILLILFLLIIAILYMQSL